MTRLTLLFALALLIASLPRAQAAVFGCAGSSVDPPECADRELVGLDKAVDARFDAVVAKADPLTALLLRRDQASVRGDRDPRVHAAEVRRCG